MPEVTRTFAHEEHLPRVPLPELADTAERFLQWCAPLLTAAELAETEQAVADLLRGPGPVLQAALQAYEAQPGVLSWLDDFWRDRYLGRRDRIALNANFFFLFRDSGQAQADRAASLLAGAVAHKLLVDEERLPPLVQRGRPLSMEQDRHLFSTTRIPGEERDSVRTPSSEQWPGPSRARHVLVLHRDQMWQLDVIGPQGRPHPARELAAAVRAIVASAGEPEPDSAVGHLTTTARAPWARARARLLAVSPDNAAALDVVETALLCLCLDDVVPESPLDACDRLLHGDGGTRWYDKSLSFVVFADGTAGYNGEHCVLDGTTVIGLLDGVLEATGEEHSERSGAQEQGPPAWAPVRLVLDDGLREQVRAAAQDFAACSAGTATTTLSLDLGADRAKALGVSPDAFAQLAFQLAHRRATGAVGTTYESIATRQYRNGRTEAMRVVTPEVLDFVEAAQDPDAPAATQAAALRTAADAHVARARKCQEGLAPEQHLWELQLLARRRGLDVGPLPLYDSPGWRVLRDDRLSTSAVPSANVPYWGFGSTSERCIGVGYAVLPDRFHLYLSTPAPVREQMLAFARELPGAVRDMEALLGA